MKRFSYLFLSILIIITFTNLACQKDEEIKTRWGISEFERQTNLMTGNIVHPDVDYLDTVMFSCIKDNQYEIDDTGVFNIFDLGENCNSLDTINGQWTFEGDQNQFMQIDLPIDYIMVIDQLWGEIKLNPTEVLITNQRWRIEEKTEDFIYLTNKIQYTGEMGQNIGEPEGIHLKFRKLE